MKRAVFLSILSLLGLPAPCFQSPGDTYLTGISPRDALAIHPKRMPTVKRSHADVFIFKHPYALNPLPGKSLKLTLASIDRSAALPTEAPITCRAWQRRAHPKKLSHAQALLLHRFNHHVKVPP